MTIGSKEVHIRSFFLHPEEKYSLTHAAAILGLSCRTLIHEAQSDRPEEYRDGRRWRFTWRQLAYIAYRVWTLAEIHAALGKDAAKVLPPLLAMRRVTVSLPEFIIRAMETAADDSGLTLDAWLHHELIDFASGDVERMETIAPGYRRAFFYPGASA